MISLQWFVKFSLEVELWLSYVHFFFPCHGSHLAFILVCVCISDVSPTKMEWPIFYVITNFYFYILICLMMSFNWEWPFAIIKYGGSVDAGPRDWLVLSRYVGFHGMPRLFCLSSVHCNNKTNWYLKQNNPLLVILDSDSVCPCRFCWEFSVHENVSRSSIKPWRSLSLLCCSHLALNW